jgi:hypothetical protein
LAGKTLIAWAGGSEMGGKRVYKLRKNPEDFTSALYPEKYNPVIGCNLTPDPVLPDMDTIIILKTPHLVDIEILENGI